MEETVKAARDTRRLFKASGGSLLGMLVAVVLCETPLLATVLIGIGAGSMVGRMNAWVDGVGIILALAAFGFARVAFSRSYRARRGGRTKPEFVGSTSAS